jgi:hypothetical protein
LRADGVDAHYRGFEIQHAQQLLDRREFLAYSIGLLLGQDHLVGFEEHADNVSHAGLIPSVVFWSELNSRIDRRHRKTPP